MTLPLLYESILGRFDTTLCFFHLWTMDRTEVHWSQKTLWKALWTFPKDWLINVNDFVSHQFYNFIRLGDKVFFFLDSASLAILLHGCRTLKSAISLYFVKMFWYLNHKKKLFFLPLFQRANTLLVLHM